MADTTSGHHGFDFLFGAWQIANRRLTSRLTGSIDWEEFPATGACRPILGGIGNVDSFSARRDGRDFEGGSYRLYNAAADEWSIYWADNVTATLQPPVTGRFQNGVGEFFGRDAHEGKPVLVRFRWTEITSDSARWEQAFSADDGTTWEINWIMTFSRTGSAEDAR